MVLQSDVEAKDVILTTRSDDGYIRFATTPTSGTFDIERQKITPSGDIGFRMLYPDDPVGRIDFNLSNDFEYHNLPKISFDDGYGKPIIKMYGLTGTDPNNPNSDSYPWWIECSGHGYGYLHFRSHNAPPWFSQIGSETPVTRVTFRSDGNVGINNTDPDVKLQVTEGNVVFDGDDDGAYETIPSGAGSRFMWLPEKSALRAGTVTGTQWNVANVGDYSVAYGYDCIASGEGSSAFGNQNNVSGINSSAFGSANIVNNHYSCAFGAQNTCSDLYTMAFGFDNTTSAQGSMVFGYNSSATGYYSVAMGYGNDASSTNAVAIGYNAKATDLDAKSIGYLVEADAEKATAMGNGISTNGYAGSFVIGDHNTPGYNCTPATNRDQMVMRFTGAPNDSSANDIVFRFITATDASCNIIHEAFLTSGSNGLISTSDRNKKRDITPVDEYNVLSRLRKVPVNTYKWKIHETYDGDKIVTDSLSNTWMGPIAQDFYAQFPIGYPDSTALSNSVMNAAMMASIQALADISDSLKEGISRNYSKSEELDTKVNNAVTQSDFNVFKDSIKCYADACDRIKDLENKVDELEGKLDSLLAELSDKNIKKNDEINSIRSSNNYNDIILEQNNPNPFAETTEINYYIPGKYHGKAKLIVADEKGVKTIKEFEICNSKPCQLKISAKDLSTGVYIYGIELNGMIVKSKKMMIIK